MSANPEFWTKEGVRQHTLPSYAPNYSPTSAYSVGQWVWYADNSSSGLYVCKTAIGSGGETWNPNHWSLINDVSSLFSNNNALLTSAIDAEIASRCNSLDPDNSSIADIINALKGNQQ